MRCRFIALGVSALLALAILTGCSKTAAPNDVQVATEVQNKIGADSRISSREIGVQAENGVVTLTGNVTTDVERASAASDAATVDGVKTVVNNLIVQAALEEVGTSTASPSSPLQRIPASSRFRSASPPAARSRGISRLIRRANGCSPRTRTRGRSICSPWTSQTGI